MIFFKSNPIHTNQRTITIQEVLEKALVSETYIELSKLLGISHVTFHKMKKFHNIQIVLGRKKPLFMDEYHISERIKDAKRREYYRSDLQLCKDKAKQFQGYLE